MGSPTSYAAPGKIRFCGLAECGFADAVAWSVIRADRGERAVVAIAYRAPDLHPERAFAISTKPVNENMVEAVSSRHLDDLEASGHVVMEKPSGQYHSGITASTLQVETWRRWRCGPGLTGRNDTMPDASVQPRIWRGS